MIPVKVLAVRYLANASESLCKGLGVSGKMTSLGMLTVQGEGLQLKTLSLEGGQVAVDGHVSALVYEEPRQTSFWGRLLG